MSLPSSTGQSASAGIQVSQEEHIERVLQRLRDAELLYNSGRTEGSLLSLLVAVAGTSRRRYPHGTKSRLDPIRGMGDKECFAAFLRDEMQTLSANPVFGSTKKFSLPVAGHVDELENLLYDFLRNPQVHEGGPSNKIRFVPGSQFFLSFADPTKLITSHWIHRALFRVLIGVPENNGVGERASFSEAHLVQWNGWHYLALESWVDGSVFTEVRLPLHREKTKQTLADLANDPHIQVGPPIQAGTARGVTP